VALEVLDVLDPRTAPAVDRLIVVADDERHDHGACEEAQPAVLDRVRVLEFVDEELLEAGAVMLEQIPVVAQELETAQQQLAEIDEPRIAAQRLVPRVELDHSPAPRVALVANVARPQALVLLSVDEPLHVAR